MRWLRKERDLIGLIMIWGLLLQSLVIPMSSTAHAAMLATGSDTAGIICTTRTASAVPLGTFAPDEQKQSQNSADCQCCHMSCRQGCGGMCGGTGLGAFAYLLTPHTAVLSAAETANGPAFYDAGALTESQPRAPPLA